MELPNGLGTIISLLQVDISGTEMDSHIASVTHVHHIGLEVKIEIDGLREVVEQKPLVGAIIRRLARWDIQAGTKEATGVAL